MNKTIAALIVLAGFIVIIISTLSPFNFNFSDFGKNVHFNAFILDWGESDFFDVLKNIYLYIFFAFGLAWFFRNIGLNWNVNFLAILIISFGISYSIEFFQLFLEYRFSSLIDVFSNCTGVCLGFLVFYLTEEKVIQYISKCFFYNTQSFCFFSLLLIFWLVFITVYIQQAVRLSNWNSSYYLIFGNEHTGDRPWLGKITKLQILNQSLSYEDIKKLVLLKESSFYKSDSFFSYTYSSSLDSYKKIGLIPDLIWRGKATNRKEILLGPQNWLESEFPPVHLINKIQESSKFTIDIDLMSFNTHQTGPARIVSLSMDTGNRNFTLGQAGNNLIFRLRTPLTEDNGTLPDFVTPNVFRNKQLLNVIITYNNGRINLYLEVRIPHLAWYVHS